MPIRVFFIIGTLERGGTEGALVEIVTRLDRERFSPVVCCLQSGGPHAETLRRAAIPVHVIGYEGLRVFRHPLRTISQIAGVVRLMRQTRAEIVHARLFWAVIIGVLAARAARVPRVVASRVSLRRTLDAQPAWWRWLERRTTGLTDLIVANSQAVREETIRLEGVKPERVVVVPNGIDLAAFDRAARPDRRSLGVACATRLVVVVANLIEYKGHDVLLDAWPAVLARVPDARVLLAGEGVRRAHLEERIAREHLAASVTLLGRRDDVPALLAASDVVVLPTFEEGLSNAILEGMAASRPIVATAVGGNSELVVPGQTGWLVPPHDAPALADAIVSALIDARQAQAFGCAGRRRVEIEFDIASVVERFESLYLDLMKPSSPRRRPSA